MVFFFRTSQVAFFQKLETQVSASTQHISYCSGPFIPPPSNTHAGNEPACAMDALANEFANALNNQILRSAVKILLSETMAQLNKSDTKPEEDEENENEIAPSMESQFNTPENKSRDEGITYRGNPDTEENFALADASFRTSAALNNMKKRRILVSRSVTNFSSVIGTITVYTKNYKTTESHGEQIRKHSSESETLFAFVPSRWITLCGLSYGFHVLISRSSKSWQVKPKTVNIVPRDSLVFQFCDTGNLEGLKTLFTNNNASVWDTDEGGFTPLHVSPLPVFSPAFHRENAQRTLTSIATLECSEIFPPQTVQISHRARCRCRARIVWTWLVSSPVTVNAVMS